MRLYSGQVPAVAQELLRALMEGEDLEVEDQNIPEVEEDIQSVLKEFIRLDREIGDQARNEIARRGSGSVGRERRKIAKQKGLSVVDDPIGYIIEQLIETFLHSHFVEEVYSGDNAFRRKLKPLLERHMSVQQELDVEVRNKIKNLEEGSAAWEIEYEKVMGNLKRTKNLD